MKTRGILLWLFIGFITLSVSVQSPLTCHTRTCNMNIWEEAVRLVGLVVLFNINIILHAIILSYCNLFKIRLIFRSSSDFMHTEVLMQNKCETLNVTSKIVCVLSYLTTRWQQWLILLSVTLDHWYNQPAGTPGSNPQNKHVAATLDSFRSSVHLMCLGGNTEAIEFYRSWAVLSLEATCRYKLNNLMVETRLAAASSPTVDFQAIIHC